jgi:hypothetical protein
MSSDETPTIQQRLFEIATRIPSVSLSKNVRFGGRYPYVWRSVRAASTVPLSLLQNVLADALQLLCHLFMFSSLLDQGSARHPSLLMASNAVRTSPRSRLLNQKKNRRSLARSRAGWNSIPNGFMASTSASALCSLDLNGIRRTRHTCCHSPFFEATALSAYRSRAA